MSNDISTPETNMDYWGTVLANMPDSYTSWFAEERAYLASVIRPNTTILEIGCGDGRSIADMLPMTDHITGIDHDDSAVTLATERFKAYKDVSIQHQDATNLTFPDTSFDFVVCLTTFANFGSDRKKIIQ